MLDALLIGEAARGRRRLDIHRHATFSCRFASWRRGWLRRFG
jgi:hypothetical protein